MPFITPSFDDIRDNILRDIRNLNPDADTGTDSDYYVRASSVASVATGIYQHQGWIVRQIFPDTADTEFLEWHARTRSLYKKSATTASGLLTLTGEPGASADAGYTVTRGDLSYITTAAVTLDSRVMALLPQMRPRQVNRVILRPASQAHFRPPQQDSTVLSSSV
jgi:uncharacterized phage protein gp47/JayE